ncbi:hypothetical protein IQ07DRAFT_338986, partial [Pyrenochaeta sp. DS3sAY3a]
LRLSPSLQLPRLCNLTWYRLCLCLLRHLLLPPLLYFLRLRGLMLPMPLAVNA